MIDSILGLLVGETTPAAVGAPKGVTERRGADESAPSPIEDRLDFSDEALRAAEAAAESGDPAESEESEGSDDSQLDAEEQAQVRELQARDAEVRAHEQAHRLAAGNLALGTTSYEYETGPDGRRYAVGGEVQIDTSPEQDPEETIAKAERIIAAASAPATPSPEDRAVAAKAAAMAAAARVELARQSDDTPPASLLNAQA